MIPALGTADPVVLVDLDDTPAAPLGNRLKLDPLVLDGLSCCADAEIERGPLGHRLAPWIPKSPVFDMGPLYSEISRFLNALCGRLRRQANRAFQEPVAGGFSVCPSRNTCRLPPAAMVHGRGRVGWSCGG